MRKTLIIAGPKTGGLTVSMSLTTIYCVDNVRRCPAYDIDKKEFCSRIGRLLRVVSSQKPHPRFLHQKRKKAYWYAIVLIVLATASNLLATEPVWAAYQGIWKDSDLGQVHNFYVQHYSTGSTIVIYTASLGDYHAFLANISGETFQADALDPGDPTNLMIEFSSENGASAVITDWSSGSPATTEFGIERVFKAVRTPHSGIWKDNSAGLNMYVQDYETGSTLVIYTFDLVRYRVFLSTFSDFGFTALNLEDQSERLTWNFSMTEPGTVTIGGTVSDTGEQSDPASYEILRVFAPPALDLSWSATPRAGTAPLQVEFMDESFLPLSSWSWRLGDGTQSTERDPSHVYTQPGSYDVSLVLGDGSAQYRLTASNYIQVTASGPVVSGTVREGASDIGVPEVTVSCLNGSTVDVDETDLTGHYFLLAPPSGNCTVTPELNGFSFTPSSIVLTGLTSDVSQQDFLAGPAGEVLTISGKVTYQGVGLKQVRLDYDGGAVLTDEAGLFTIQVTKGWTGNLTPSKSGYAFTPPAYSYEDLASDQTNRNFTAVADTVTIGGRITHNGTGLSAISVKFEDITVIVSATAEFAKTDALGYYEKGVPSGWTGEVTPISNDYTFSPSSIIYSGVAVDQSGQDFSVLQGGEADLIVSGIVYAPSGSPLEGATVRRYDQGIVAPVNEFVTETDGEYSFIVPYAWSGSITVGAEGYVFPQATLQLSSVTADQPGNDFQASFSSSDVPEISGTVYDPSGQPLAGATVVIYEKEVPVDEFVTDTNGRYSFTVSYAWSGSVTVGAHGYVFQQATIVFNSVIKDQTGRDFHASSLSSYDPEISGTVFDLAGLPMEGAILRLYERDVALPIDEFVTDTNGRYSFTVSYAWSGSVTVGAHGYVFQQATIVFDSVITDQTGRDFHASSLSSYDPEISGTVFDLAGLPMEGAILRLYERDVALPIDEFVTDSNGTYSFTVASGWAGYLSAAAEGVVFKPSAITLDSINADEPGLNFFAVLAPATSYGYLEMQLP